MLRGLRHALLFLTRIPVGALSIDAKGWGDSLTFFPLVGLIIGGALWIAAQLFDSAGPELSAALVLLLWVMLTGALHLDGLADSVDAWVGGLGDSAKTLEIMKDPRCGAMGVVGLILALLLKYTALCVLIDAEFFLLLVAIPVWARGVLIWVFVTTPYARKEGLARDMIGQLSINTLVWVLPASMLLPMLLINTMMVWLLVGALAAVCLLWRRAVTTRIKGFTGDTLGALVEISETILLLMAALTL